MATPSTHHLTLQRGTRVLRTVPLTDVPIYIGRADAILKRKLDATDVTIPRRAVPRRAFPGLVAIESTIVRRVILLSLVMGIIGGRHGDNFLHGMFSG